MKREALAFCVVAAGWGYSTAATTHLASAADELKLAPKKPAAAAAKPAPASTTPAPAAQKLTPAKPAGSTVAKAAVPRAAHTPQRLQVEAVGEDPQQAWQQYFASHDDVPNEDVRETVRQLMAARQFDQVTGLIQAALVQGRAQSWMYEALALALEAAGSPKSEIERALMSAVDFGESPEDLMYAAQYMIRFGLEARALKVFQQVAKIEPNRPEPYVFGLNLAERHPDPAVVEWASLGILRQSWPVAQRVIEEKATNAILAAIANLKAQKKLPEAAALQQRLEQALVRDCLIRVTWTGDADVDLFVEEPPGTICSARNPRTTSGGLMLGDASSRSTVKNQRGTTETYVCPEGFNGTYRLLLRRVWGQITAGKVTVDVYTHYGTRQVRHERQQLSLGDQDAAALFILADGRRQDSLAEQQVATAAAGQIAIGQALLTQQINSQTSGGTSATASIGNSRAGIVGGFPFIRGAVGYQPVIITLPSGANFSATGVISADRRYVRITALPLFSQIGQVTTFNIGSGTVGTSPTPPPGGGGVSPPGNAFPPANTGTGSTTGGATGANANPNPVANPVNGNPQ